MLQTASRQAGFFDASELIGPLPEGSFYALLAEHGERIVSDQDFADCYSERQGRPSIPPSQLAKVMLLQYRTGRSDREAMEAVQWDLRWKAALDLPVDHQGWDPTSLVRFRARLILHGKERLVLENSLKIAEELGLLDAPAEQIVDSTPMLGAAATQDTVRLVRSGVRKLLDAVGAADQDAGAQLSDSLEFDYQKPAEKPDCRWRERSERERMLTRVAQDAERALRAVEQAAGLLEDEVVKDAHALLRELIGQDFDVESDGIPHLHRGTRSGRILSVHDPEMRHGRKSSQQRFDGFKLHAAATNSETPLLTAIAVTAASEQDGPQAKELVDQQSQQRKPTRIVGDTAYGNGPVRQELDERSVEVLAPVPEAPANDDRLLKREFRIDLDEGTVTCPAGQVAQITTAQSGERWASFTKPVCDACPLRARCVGPVKGRRQIRIAPEEELMIAARQALDDPTTAEHLRRTRPRIERLLSLLAHRYGARKSRYRGTSKAALQAAWTAALVNLNPIGARLAEQAV
jgi:transposase